LSDTANKVQRPLQQGQRLIEVDYMNPGPLGEDVALHLGVPPLGLVSEMDAGLEQLSDSYALGCALQDHYLSLKVVGILRPRLAIRPWISRRTTTRVRRTLRRACVVVEETLKYSLLRPRRCLHKGGGGF